MLEAGFRVFAQDSGFSDEACRKEFGAERAELILLSGSTPEEVIASVFEATEWLDALVSNDHYPAPAMLPAFAPTSELDANYQKLVAQPFALVQGALPYLKRRGANIVMITSNRTRLPLSGGAFPDAARAAANAMVRSLAIDFAADGIVINAVAPNFLYSEAYYPKALFKESEQGRAYVRASVPVGRLAAPDEIGEVIKFLATVKARFFTGAILDFSGGWPFGPARPSL